LIQIVPVFTWPQIPRPVGALWSCTTTVHDHSGESSTWATLPHAEQTLKSASTCFSCTGGGGQTHCPRCLARCCGQHRMCGVLVPINTQQLAIIANEQVRHSSHCALHSAHIGMLRSGDVRCGDSPLQTHACPDGQRAHPSRVGGGVGCGTSETTGISVGGLGPAISKGLWRSRLSLCAPWPLAEGPLISFRGKGESIGLGSTGVRPPAVSPAWSNGGGAPDIVVALVSSRFLLRSCCSSCCPWRSERSSQMLS
jgi:hypothetical protein